MLEHLPSVDVVDKPDVVARVFKLKLDQLLDLIKNKNYFDKSIGGIALIAYLTIVNLYIKKNMIYQ